MKKLILTFVCLCASNQLLAWEIPIQNCEQIEGEGRLWMTNTKLKNANVLIRRDHESYQTGRKKLKVECTSAVISNYGSRLDVDIKYNNTNSNEPIKCEAKSYHRGVEIEDSPTVSSRNGASGTIELRPAARDTEDPSPEVIRVYCTIPHLDYVYGVDGYLSGQAELWPYAEDNGAYIYSIRVY